jgi:predicted nuclease with TOPRIM domain
MNNIMCAEKNNNEFILKDFEKIKIKLDEANEKLRKKEKENHKLENKLEESSQISDKFDNLNEKFLKILTKKKELESDLKITNENLLK